MHLHLGNSCFYVRAKTMYNTLMADDQPQPGEVVIPIERDAPTSAPVQTQAEPSFDVPAAPAEEITQPVAPVVTTEASMPESPNPLQTPSPVPTQGVSWRAQEFIGGSKNRAWYALVAVGAIVISTIIYFLNHDVITAVIVLIALIGLAYVSGRKPREQDFVVTNEGVGVGQNYYPFQNFRSFAISEDQSATSFILIPLKRFMPAVNVFVPMEYEQAVMAIISGVLPFDQHHVDVVDSLMRRIHF